MKKMILLALSLFLLLACKDENDCGCNPPNDSVGLTVKDSNGNAMINSENFEQIRILFKNGENVTFAENPQFINEDNQAAIYFHLNTEGAEEFPITYIEWNDEDTDTIEAEFKNYRLKRFWINGTIMSELERDNFFYIIVK